MDRAVIEGSLRDSEARLELALDAAEQAAWVWDIVEDEIYWNQRHFLILGLEPRPGTVQAHDFLDHIHPDDSDWVQVRLGESVETAGPFQAEFRIVRADTGEVRWMSGHGRTTESSGGRATRMAGCMFDVTDRHLAQEVLQRSHDELERRVQERTEELAEALQQIQALHKRVVTAQEEERARIAEDIHHNLNEHLTAVLLGLGTLETQVRAALKEDPRSKIPVLNRLQSLVNDLMKSAHLKAVELRPPALDSMGLEAALGQFVREWSERSGIEGDFQYLGFEKRLDFESETALYRVVQEALTNVGRHADAKVVSVVLQQNATATTAIIEDNGVGFVEANQSDQLGILGMRERMAIVGGTLEIESRLGGGTTVFASVPH